MMTTDLSDLVGRIIKWRSPHQDGKGEYRGTAFIRRLTYDPRILVSDLIEGDELAVEADLYIIIHAVGGQPIEYVVTNVGQWCIFKSSSHLHDVTAYSLFTSRNDAQQGLARIRRVCIANGISVTGGFETGLEIISGNDIVSRFYIEEIGY